MNLQSKGARRTLGVVCSTAIVAAGVSLLATPASASKAKSTLTVSPSNTAITVLDWGKQAAINGGAADLVQVLSNATYATRVTSSVTGTLKLSWDSYTAPTGVAPGVTTKLLYGEVLTGGTTGPAFSGVTGNWSTLSDPGAGNWPATSSALTLASGYTTKDLFLAPNNPGTYTFHFVDSGAAAGTDDDVLSPTVTMTVLDIKNGAVASGAAAVGGGTAATTDDWLPTVAVSSSSTSVGAPLNASLPLSGLTTVDARGSSLSTGVLATKTAARASIQYNSTTPGAGAGQTTDTAAGLDTADALGQLDLPFGLVASGTTASRSIPPYTTLGALYATGGGAVAGARSITTTALFDYDGNGFGGTTSALTVDPSATTITDTPATAVALAPTAVSGTVAAPTATTVSVKSGTASVAYVATTTPANAGIPVYFTVVNGTNAPTMSADGTLYSSATVGAVTTKVYTVLTGSGGIATLNVTSGTTTAGTSYQVQATAGTSQSTQQTATYSAGSGSTATIADTTSAAAKNPVVGTNSVVLTGTMSDAFGLPYTPTSSDSAQSVEVYINGIQAGTASVSDGKFSWTYTPSTTPVSGTTATYYFKWVPKPSTTTTQTIHWAAATAAGTVTLSNPSDNSTGAAVQSHATPAGTAVSGAVTDASGNAIAYKLVKLSGGNGVMFSSTSNGASGLASTLDVATDSAGQFTAYVFYTKSGDTTVTATADDKSATSHVTTATPTGDSVAYKVVVKDAFVTPGGTATVSGKVTDVFGNPVYNATVNLSVGSTDLGAFTDSAPESNTGGVFTASFPTSDSTSVGTATITATLNGQTASRTAATGWATGGVTLPGGSYMDQATLTVAKAQETTITGPASRVGAGSVTLTGKALPGASVEIYGKPAGTSIAFALIGVATADDSGNWSDAEYIARSTTFFAKTSSSTSSTITVAVSSVRATVKVSAKAIGRGVVKVSVNGSPNKKGTITYYVNGRKVKAMTSNAAGDGSLSIKTGKGRKTVKVVFAPSGYIAGSASVVVTVR